MPEKKYKRNKDFGSRVKAEILRQFGNQARFCRARGFTNSAVSGYCRGVVPEWPGLVALREALGVSIDYLLVGAAEANQRLVDLPAPLPEVIRLWPLLSPEAQAAVVQMLRYRETAGPAINRWLIKAVESLDALDQTIQRLHKQPPGDMDPVL
jgi:hypothetical protein